MTTISPTPKINLLGLDKKAMQDFFVSVGEKPYRADQVLKWIHFKGIDFQAMTNFSKDLRQKLTEIAEITFRKSSMKKQLPMAHTNGCYA